MELNNKPTIHIYFRHSTHTILTVFKCNPHTSKIVTNLEEILLSQLLIYGFSYQSTKKLLHKNSFTLLKPSSTFFLTLLP